MSDNDIFCSKCGNRKKNEIVTTEYSFINNTYDAEENNSSQINVEKRSIVSVSINKIYAASIIFGVLIITIIICLIVIFKSNSYRPIQKVEELIAMKNYSKAEELCYSMIYNEDTLSSYAEGALLRISEEYASMGKHNDAKKVLEVILSAKPSSFLGRTGYVFTSALSGDVVSTIKGISEIPNINAFIPNISLILKDSSSGKIGNITELIEQILKAIFIMK